MVEVHREEWEALLAVSARHSSQLLDQGGLLAPPPTLDDWRVTGLNTEAPSFERPQIGPCAVAIRADDVAFPELCDEPLPRNAAGSLQEPEAPRAPCVVEVHHVGRKSITAIRARDIAQGP